MAVVMEKVGMIGKENSTSEVVTKKDLEVEIEKQDKDIVLDFDEREIPTVVKTILGKPILGNPILTPYGSCRRPFSGV